MRLLIIFVLVLMLSNTSRAQTETPTPTLTPTETLTPTPTNTPTPEPWIYITIAPESTDEASGQMTRFDYTATAGDVQIANLLTWILASLWAMFLLFVLFLSVIWRRR